MSENEIHISNSSCFPISKLDCHAGRSQLDIIVSTINRKSSANIDIRDPTDVRGRVIGFDDGR